MRRFVVYFLSSVLFVSLLAIAITTALNLDFHSPDKVETWLSQSGVYTHVVPYAIQQSQKNTTDQANTDSLVSLGDAQVQHAVQAAFSPQDIQKAVNTFLNANYAWLEGKTATPQFSIDLSENKAAMAANLAQYSKSRAAHLPSCTPAQLLELENTSQTYNILNATCIPSGVTPATAAQVVQTDALTTQSFLPNTSLTPTNIGQQNLIRAGATSQAPQTPYYASLSFLPIVYIWATRLPWILGGLSVACAIGILMLAGTRRQGLRRITYIAATTGAIILVLSFVSTTILARSAVVHAVAHSDFGLLQQSILNVIHTALVSLAHTELWFGAAYLALSTGIIVVLLLMRGRQQHKPSSRLTSAENVTPQAYGTSVSDATTRRELVTQNNNVSDQDKRPPKPPTLIQL
ncbi:MAG TPA: hypothetical protein VFN56_02995 [Candidatus Saccharimonadales bacterium]|nr:hypothetical protein [Candidatus Saccharimonadales bacterium]